jgi:ABC-type lipoprotein release transport system permease subunit
LFGVSAFDPLTAVVVPLLLTIVGLAAAYVPARRAARLQPLTVLRMN